MMQRTPLLPQVSTRDRPDRVHGNAAIDGEAFHSWIVGHFVPESLAPRFSNDVEIKWATHRAGERQSEWTVNETATTISILIRGRDRISFPDGDVVLEHEGDYVLWGPGVPHRWRAETEAVVITVRWPSTSNDSSVITGGEAAAWASSGDHERDDGNLGR
jgi:quercetin dioxygenase-like cupin family protein